MKLLLLISLCLISQFSNGQIKIGFTESEIVTMLPHRNLKKDIADDGRKFIYWQNSDFNYAYFFNSEGFTDRNVIIANSDSALKTLLKTFNSGVIVKKNEWIWANKDGIYWITLTYQEGVPIFKVMPGKQ